MKIVVRLQIITAAAFFQLGCKEPAVPEMATKLKLVGVNDSANYYVFRSSGEVVFVMKSEYEKLGEYAIQIQRDTLELGEEFHGYFSIFKTPYTVRINQPQPETIAGESKNPLTQDSKTYVFKPTKVGVYDFQGEVEFDSRVIPFHYKFIVQ